MRSKDTVAPAGFVYGKWISIGLIVIAQCAVMSLWFTATAVVPQLKAQYAFSSVHIAALTSSVQLGFVVGTLISAILSLADRLDSRRFFFSAALAGAAANFGMTLVDATGFWFIALRFLVGVCMAGVYPVGMKMVASWTTGDLGLLMGLVVGALTLGAAAPSLASALGGEEWRLVLIMATAVAVFGALLGGVARLGSPPARRPKFRFDDALVAWRVPALRLANLGYLGHMWELYAMWAWIGVFLHMSFAYRGMGVAGADVLTFATIASGAVGCIGAGLLADRIGRTATTVGAMLLSGLCAMTIGWAFDGPLWVLIALCVIWGVTVVADSAQFSASVTELADARYIGTVLTVQVCAGFLLTVCSIQILPIVIDLLTWQYAFIVLAIGPFGGAWAMYRLRRNPMSTRLAGGRR